MSEIDTNKDNRLSYKEMRAYFKGWSKKEVEKVTKNVLARAKERMEPVPKKKTNTYKRTPYHRRYAPVASKRKPWVVCDVQFDMM